MTKADKEGQRKTPILRFKGFTDAWEQRKLGKQNKITMGQSPSSKNYTDNPNDWILIQGNADLKNGKVAPRLYTSQVTKKADIGDIILTVRAPVGEVAITDYKAILGRGVASIKGNLFIYFALEKFKTNNKWNMYSSGSTFDSITGKDLNNLSLFFPSKMEENKIGELLNKLDSLLALYERKTKLIKQIQSSFLDKFFFEPNNVTSLNHFLRIRNGYAFKSSKLTENGEIPVVRISNIGNDKSFAFTTKEKNKEQFALYPNDIVIALSGATAGKINQVSNKYPLYYQNQRVGFFERKNDKLDYEYLNSFLHSKKFKSQLQKTLVAGAQPNIAPKDIEKIKIPFIGYKLQQKIGQVNKYLFELQRINKSKFTLLDKIKKTLLNNMFV